MEGPSKFLHLLVLVCAISLSAVAAACWRTSRLTERRPEQVRVPTRSKLPLGSGPRYNLMVAGRRTRIDDYFRYRATKQPRRQSAGH